MLPPNLIFFVDLQTLPKCIGLYGGLNISRVKFSLLTPKPRNQQKLTPSKYLGYTVHMDYAIIALYLSPQSYCMNLLNHSVVMRYISFVRKSPLWVHSTH